MNKCLAAFVATLILVLGVSSAYAEDFKSLFGDVSGGIIGLLGGDSNEEETKETSGNLLNDIGTIIGGITAEENGIPKTIHYEDYELFKKDIDAIEEYFKKYADFMKNYDASDLSMLADYTSLMASYVDASRVLESLDEDKMTEKEKKYYNTVLLRINKILYDAL